jgi:iron complex outermembrane receptor protein
MKRALFLCSAATAVALAAAPAAAQTVPEGTAADGTTSSGDVQASGNAPAPGEPQVADAGQEDIIVSGVRASLASAQNIKRNAESIVDSIVAEDIGKLPDNNATEALQRVTGVQVSRDVGEGGSIAIRGLPQVETTLNGRETFTASAGRTFNLQDLPAELIARIDVFKSPTADIIEGGLGGTVDIRTRRPMDFAGFTGSATLRNQYSDSIKKSAPSASLLLSNRWATGIGEIGLLGAVSYQKRRYRQDLNGTGAPIPRTDLIAGQSVFAPNGFNQVLIAGTRERIGGNAALQWRPTPNLEVVIEGQYQRFKTVQDQFNALTATAGLTPVAGSARLFDGTNNIERATYLNVPFTAGGTSSDFVEENKTISGNIKWTSGGLTLSGDATYTKSTNDLEYTELDLTRRIPTLTQIIGTNPPSETAPGFNAADLSQYTVASLTRNENHFRGDEKAFRLDATYEMDGGLKALQAGFRFSDRTVAQVNPLRFNRTPTNTNPANYPGFFQANGYGDFYAIAGGSNDFIRDYPYATPDVLRGNFNDVLQQLRFIGADAPSTTSINSQLAAFDAVEKSYAAYALARFGFDLGLRVDGNVGVRWVKTELDIRGNQLRTTSANQPVIPNVVDPVAVDSSYDNFLPSGNLRAHLTEKLQLRLAASRTLTRPDFSQLSPALTVNPGQLSAAQGNPTLSPILSTNLDASLEWYFGRSSSVYVAGFHKRVKGFIFTRATPNVTIGGLPNYTLSQPENAGTGTVKGVEVGYQQFFDFLPGALSGLGVQANYTYADSSAPTSLAGFTATLPQLSKHSYNVVGIYEKSGLSARVAYNHRSDFLSGILAGAFTPPGGTSVPYIFPIRTQGYGWLDAAISYDVSDRFTISVDAQNLLRTQIQQFYDVSTRPGNYTVDDTQYMIGVRIKL